MTGLHAKDGTHIHVNDWGSGPPVVLIHGWPVHSDMWEYQITALVEAGFRVIAYDRRGFGKSGQPWSGFDYDTLASDLDCIMTKFDLYGATLVGFSMAGGEVARYLGRYGTQRVAKAVLISAVTPFLMKSDANPDGVDGSAFAQMLDGIQQDRPGFRAGLLNFSVSNEILHWWLGMAMQGSMRATMQCVHAFSETDFRSDMTAFACPTLVIHGDADATVPIERSGRRAAQMIPGAKLLEYGGAPHGLTYTERDRLNADLIGFIGAAG